MSARDALDRYRKSIELGMRPDEAATLRDYERRIKLLENYAAFASMPAVKDFADWAARQVRTVNEQLSTDRDLMRDGREAERLAMLNRKDVLLYLLGLFDPSADLEEIETSLSSLATRYEEYQSGRG